MRPDRSRPVILIAAVDWTCDFFVSGRFKNFKVMVIIDEVSLSMAITEIIIISIFSFVGLFGSLLMFIVMRPSYQDSKEIKQILKNGTPARAIVNSIQQTETKINDNPQVMIGVTVTKENGETFYSAFKTVIPVILFSQFSKGSMVKVKYMEDGNKRKVALEGSYILK
jgi:hypothetical protein